MSCQRQWTKRRPIQLNKILYLYNITQAKKLALLEKYIFTINEIIILSGKFKPILIKFAWAITEIDQWYPLYQPISIYKFALKVKNLVIIETAVFYEDFKPWEKP